MTPFDPMQQIVNRISVDFNKSDGHPSTTLDQNTCSMIKYLHDHPSAPPQHFDERLFDERLSNAELPNFQTKLDIVSPRKKTKGTI
jgi:hypothetical protein